MYPITADQKENFLFISEFIDTDKNVMILKINVSPESQELCQKLGKLFKKNFEGLFVDYQGSLAIPSGKLRTDAFTFNAYKFSVDNTSQVSYTSLNFGEVIGHWVGAQSRRTLGADEKDYESHLGTKLDYIMYFNAEQLRHSEMKLLQNQCEHERTQILNFLTLAMQNTRPAGYMLTGNRSPMVVSHGYIIVQNFCRL